MFNVDLELKNVVYKQACNRQDRKIYTSRLAVFFSSITILSLFLFLLFNLALPSSAMENCSTILGDSYVNLYILAVCSIVIAFLFLLVGTQILPEESANRYAIELDIDNDGIFNYSYLSQEDYSEKNDNPLYKTKVVTDILSLDNIDFDKDTKRVVMTGEFVSSYRTNNPYSDNDDPVDKNHQFVFYDFFIPSAYVKIEELRNSKTNR